MDPMLQELAKREARLLTTIWLALAISVGVYMLVGAMFSGSGNEVSRRAFVEIGTLELGLGTVRIIFITLAFGLLGATAWVSRRQLADDVILDHSTGATDEDKVANGFAYLKRYSLLAWGLAEGVILAGTLLAIMTGRPIDVIPYAIAGATSLFLLKPEELSLIDLATRMVARPA